MTFSLDKAILQDLKCRVLLHDGEHFPDNRFDGRIICHDRKETEHIVVLCDVEGTETLYTVDWKGIGDGGNVILENANEEVDVYVIAYWHKSNGEIKISAKMSESEAEGTVFDLKRLGHEVIGTRQVTIKEGITSWSKEITDFEE